jgi:hypothetical protein
MLASSYFNFFFVFDTSHSESGLSSGKTLDKSFLLPSSKGLTNISASLSLPVPSSLCS